MVGTSGNDQRRSLTASKARQFSYHRAQAVFKLVRIFCESRQPDHLKRFFALFGTRSLVSKSFVPALAQKTRLLVQNFSESKILTKFDGHGKFRTQTIGGKHSVKMEKSGERPIAEAGLTLYASLGTLPPGTSRSSAKIAPRGAEAITAKPTTKGEEDAELDQAALESGVD